MSANITARSVYYWVSAALMLLLAATVAAAQLNLGAWNTPIALGIATAKAALIMLFFMHLRFTSAPIRVFALGGFVWLLILQALIMTDYLARTYP